MVKQVNHQRHVAQGVRDAEPASPWEEITRALIGIGLVLSAVFGPMAVLRRLYRRHLPPVFRDRYRGHGRDTRIRDWLAVSPTQVAAQPARHARTSPRQALWVFWGSPAERQKRLNLLLFNGLRKTHPTGLEPVTPGLGSGGQAHLLQYSHTQHVPLEASPARPVRFTQGRQSRGAEGLNPRCGRDTPPHNRHGATERG